MEHLSKTTTDGAQLNLDALYRICPSCFTESKSEDGSIKRAIDWSKLRSLLGDNIEDNEPEVYDFTWVGKRAAQREAAAPISKTLRPCPEESVDWDTTQNLYIEGDNLEVLKLLQNSYMGKVKMIYIDPPYNTGNDFVYCDERTLSEDDYNSTLTDELGRRLIKNTYSNGTFHSKWCSMIYSRLIIARTLLKEDGAIFISIDDNEVDNLRKICDEVFGSDRFVASFVWEKKKKPSFLNVNIGTKTEYILCYAKDRNLLGALSVDTTEEGKKYPFNNAGNTLADLTFSAGSVSFKMPDGIVEPQDMSEGNIKTELLTRLIIENGVNKNDFTLRGEWRYSQTTLKEIINNHDSIVISKIPFRPNHIKKGGEVKKMHNLLSINGYNPGTNEDATAEQVKLFGKSYFDYAKPVDLIKLLIKATTYNEPDSIILDFFSGSATTGHATILENQEDSGNRRFILVQIPEETPSDSDALTDGYDNICEIGKERIRRAGNLLLNNESNEHSVNTLFDSEMPKARLDTGFRVFKCESSNFKDVKISPDEYSQEGLDVYLDNIKEDRSDLDLLFDCMLRWGVELSLPISKKQVGDCTIHNVNDGDLVACFNGIITEEIISAIAEMNPLRVVFRDNSFEEASQKMNLFELFKQKCDWSDQEVMNNVKVI